VVTNVSEELIGYIREFSEDAIKEKINISETFFKQDKNNETVL